MADELLIFAWAMARDIGARGGKAGYRAGSDGIFLVIDLPLYGHPLQVSYPVAPGFVRDYPLPPYIGVRHGRTANAQILGLYGAYVGNSHAAMNGGAPAADPVAPPPHRAVATHVRRAGSRKIGVQSTLSADELRAIQARETQFIRSLAPS